MRTLLSPYSLLISFADTTFLGEGSCHAVVSGGASRYCDSIRLLIPAFMVSHVHDLVSLITDLQMC